MLYGTSRPALGFRVEAVVLNDSATGLIGRAVWTDETDNHVYSELRGEITPAGNRIVGTIVGGSGVTMNGLIPSLETQTPLQIPTRAPKPRPTARPRATTAGSETPALAKLVIASALATLTAETVVPSERSKPRVRMTIICPEANSKR